MTRGFSCSVISLHKPIQATQAVSSSPAPPALSPGKLLYYFYLVKVIRLKWRGINLSTSKLWLEMYFLPTDTLCICTFYKNHTRHWVGVEKKENLGAHRLYLKCFIRHGLIWGGREESRFLKLCSSMLLLRGNY